MTAVDVFVLFLMPATIIIVSYFAVRSLNKREVKAPEKPVRIAVNFDAMRSSAANDQARTRAAR